MARLILSVTAVADADLSGRTAYKIGNTFTAQPEFSIVWARGIDCLEAVAVLFGITGVKTLNFGVNRIVVSAAETCSWIAVADAEETDAGGLIGLVKLFKLKGGLWFGCACVCR